MSRARLITIGGGAIRLRAGLTSCEVDVRTTASGTDLKAAFALDPRIPLVLAALFISLKLAHVTDWSWAAVTAPLWGALALAALSAAFVMLVAVRRGTGKEAGDA